MLTLFCRNTISHSLKRSFHRSSVTPKNPGFWEKTFSILTEGTRATKLEQVRRCEESSLKDLKNRDSWKPYTFAESTFTDPEQFNLAKYQFIVHSLRKSVDPDNVTLLDKPENINNLILSTSLINQETQNLYGGNNGLILLIPHHCIYAASYYDMWVRNKAIEKGPNKTLEELTRVNHEYGIKIPSEILEISRNGRMYNEILVMGTNFQKQPGEVLISGVFFKHRKNKIPERLTNLQTLMMDFAKKQNLPILTSFETIPFRMKKEILFNVKSRITETTNATEETVSKHLHIVEQYFETNRKLGECLSHFLDEKKCADIYEQIEILLDKSEYLKAWHLDYMEQLNKEEEISSII